MSFKSHASGRTAWWARRRYQALALGLAALVGTGAAAQASSFGGHFLKNSAAGTKHVSSRPVSEHMDNDQRKVGTRTTSFTGTSWGMSPNWSWNGTGTNRFAFRSFVTAADPNFNQLLGINDAGQISGYFGSGEDAKHPNKGFVILPPYGGHSLRDVNYPGSVQTQVVGIANDGTLVGFYVDRRGANHGFIRWHDRFRTVDFPGTTSHPKFVQLLGISSTGIVAGFFNDAAGNAHGFLFDLRTSRFALVQLPVRATSVTVTGINARGQVVGFFTVGKITNAFLWSKRSFLVIKLGNRTNTQALGINNKGVVVGSFVDGAGVTRGFVWVPGLLRTVTFPKSTSTVVNGINNNGLIVGFYTDKSKRTLGFLARH